MITWLLWRLSTYPLAYYLVSPLLFGHRPPGPIYDPIFLISTTMGIAIWEFAEWAWRRWRAGRARRGWAS